MIYIYTGFVVDAYDVADTDADVVSDADVVIYTYIVTCDTVYTGNAIDTDDVDGADVDVNTDDDDYDDDDCDEYIVYGACCYDTVH